MNVKPLTRKQALLAVAYSHKTAKQHAAAVTAAHHKYIIRQESGAVLRDAVSGNVIETDDVGYACAALFSAGGNGARIVSRWNWRENPLPVMQGRA